MAIYETFTELYANIGRTRYERDKNFFNSCGLNNEKTLKILLLRDVNINEAHDNGTTPLINAIRHGKSENVRFLLNCGAVVNLSDEQFYSPLHHACKLKSKEQSLCIISMLLESGARVNAITESGLTPLMLEYWHPKAINLLLGAKAKTDTEDKYGRTVLLCACITNCKKSVEILLKHGMALNEQNSFGKYPLMFAAENNSHDVVQCLYRFGAKMNARDFKGQTALFYACHAKAIETIAVLIRLGADVNLTSINNGTPLMACISDDAFTRLDETDLTADTCKTKSSQEIQAEIVPCVNVLLNAKAHIDRTNAKQQTALMLAAQNNQRYIVELLMLRGADAGIKDFNGNTALCYACLKDAVETTKYLTDKKTLNTYSININTKNSDCQTPLMLSVKANANNAALSLLENGANIDETDQWGNSALILGSSKNAIYTVKLLLNFQADASIKNMAGETALMKAAQRNYGAITEALIKCFDNLEAKDQQGNTALLHASSKNARETAKLILQHKADVNNANAYGQTPLIVASLTGNSNLMLLLLKYSVTLDQEDNSGFSALFYALLCKSRSCFKLLLAERASVHLLNKGKRSLLMLAARANAVKFVELLLENFADLSQKDDRGQTSLFYACERNAVDAAKLLVSKGASVSATSKNGRTPLMLAAKSNATDVLKHLIDSGADVDSCDNQGITAFALAARNESLESLKLLLKHGASINAACLDGSTPLIESAMRNQIDILKFLLENGANVDASDLRHNTALSEACRANAVPAATLCLTHRADVSLRVMGGYPILTIAVIAGAFDIVPSLLECGAAINAQDVHGNTALFHACDRKMQEIIPFLFNRGSDVNLPNTQGVTPLMILSRSGLLSILDVLHLDDLQVDAKDFEGNTALFHAIRGKAISAVSWCIERKANIHHRNKAGLTPILLAVKCKHSKIVEILLKNGADALDRDANDNTALHMASEQDDLLTTRKLAKFLRSLDPFNSQGKTPLMCAAENEARYLVEYLLDNGADVLKRDIDGNTALLFAATNTSTDAIHLLVDCGTNVNDRNNLDQTPLMLAAAERSTKTFILLLQYGANPTYRDSSGESAMAYAASQNNPRAIEALLQHKNACVRTAFENNTAQDIDQQRSPYQESAVSHVYTFKIRKFNPAVHMTNNAGQTPLMLAARENACSAMELLLSCGADVHQRDKNGNTALHLALETKAERSSEMLVGYFVNTQIANNNLQTPLMLAARSNMQNVLKTLLEHDHSTECCDKDGDTALIYACRANSAESIRLLCSSNVKVDHQNIAGRTALMEASAHAEIKTMCILLENGAQIELCDKEGHTALATAIRCKAVRAIEALITKGANRNNISDMLRMQLEQLFSSTNSPPLQDDTTLSNRKSNSQMPARQHSITSECDDMPQGGFFSSQQNKTRAADSKFFLEKDTVTVAVDARHSIIGPKIKLISSRTESKSKPVLTDNLIEHIAGIVKNDFLFLGLSLGFRGGFLLFIQERHKESRQNQVKELLQKWRSRPKGDMAQLLDALDLLGRADVVHHIQTTKAGENKKRIIRGSNLKQLYREFITTCNARKLPDHIYGFQLNEYQDKIYVYANKRNTDEAAKFIDGNVELRKCLNVEVVGINAPENLSCVNCDRVECESLSDKLDNVTKPWVGLGSKILAVETSVWKKYIKKRRHSFPNLRDLSCFMKKDIAEQPELVCNNFAVGCHMITRDSKHIILTCYHGVSRIKQGVEMTFLTEVMIGNEISIKILSDSYIHEDSFCGGYSKSKCVDVLVLDVHEEILHLLETKLITSCKPSYNEGSVQLQIADSIASKSTVTKRGPVTGVTHGKVIANHVNLQQHRKALSESFAVGSVQVDEEKISPFAKKGDSGSLVVQKQKEADQTLMNACGMVWKSLEVRNDITETNDTNAVVCSKLHVNLQYLKDNDQQFYNLDFPPPNVTQLAESTTPSETPAAGASQLSAPISASVNHSASTLPSVRFAVDQEQEPEPVLSLNLSCKNEK